MDSIKLSPDLNILYVYKNKVFLDSAKSFYKRAKGLLLSKVSEQSKGLLFQNCRFFHTFGMQFNIAVFALNHEKQIIALPIKIKPNQIFICPKNTKYVIETHEKYANFINDNFESKIKIFNIFSFNQHFNLIKCVKYFGILFLSFLFFCTVFANSIELHLGQSRTINLQNSPQTIQIDDPEILELERIGITNSIKLIPKQLGQTQLTFHYLEDNEETLIVDIVALPSEIQTLLSTQSVSFDQKNPSFEFALQKIKKISWIEHSVNAGKIFIFGQISTLEQLHELSKIILSDPSFFYPSFEIDPSIVGFIIDSLNTEVHKMGEKNLKIYKHDDKFFLKGIANSEKQKNKIWNYLNAILPNLVDATNTFYGDSTLVQVNFEFFEVGQGLKKEAGFQYPSLGSEGSGFLMTSQTVQKPMFQITPFSVFFRALSSRNYVKEIAKPVLITRSGEKASFLAGGEVPIPSVTVNATTTNTSVQFKSVGIFFDILPKANDDGTIWLNLNAEYSQINESLSYQKTPGFNSRKISTNIILKEGITAVISGMIQNIDIKKHEQIPILSQLPILGEFFKNKQSANHSTELWIAVSAVQKRNL